MKAVNEHKIAQIKSELQQLDSRRQILLSELRETCSGMTITSLDIYRCMIPAIRLQNIPLTTPAHNTPDGDRLILQSAVLPHRFFG